MTRVPRGGGSQEGTTGDLLSHQPEFMGTPLNYYELRESHQVSPRVRGEGHQGVGPTRNLQVTSSTAHSGGGDQTASSDVNSAWAHAPPTGDFSGDLASE